MRRPRVTDEHGERGSAPVEFALVLIVLIPLFLGILQLGLFLHVRNTMTACAHEGARVGANYNRTPDDGLRAAAACVDGALGSTWPHTASASSDGNMVTVEMTVDMPALGLFGTAFSFPVSGHAVKEPPVN